MKNILIYEGYIDKNAYILYVNTNKNEDYEIECSFQTKNLRIKEFDKNNLAFKL